MWFEGIRLRKALRRTIQAPLHEPGKVAHGAITVLIVIEQLLAYCHDLIIVHGDLQVHFTVELPDHVHNNTILCLRR